MSDNVLQTLQGLIQDVIAPDVRELKVRVSSLEKHIDVRFDAVEQRFQGIEQRFQGIEQRFQGIDRQFESLEQKQEAHFRAIMAAISESKAQSELASMRMIASLSERVAVLESQRH